MISEKTGIQDRLKKKAVLFAAFLVFPIMLGAQEEVLTYLSGNTDTIPCQISQKQGSTDLLNRIFVPIEIGINVPMQKEMQAGFTSKFSIEWRMRQLDGLCISLIYNAREFDYHNIKPKESNLMSGIVFFHDVMAGIGYRWHLGKTPFCLAAQGFGGVVINNYHSIDPVEDGYESVKHRCLLPAARANIFFEYYFGQGFCIYLSAAYIQHLKQSPFTTSIAKDGCFDLSVGINTSF